MVNVVGNILTPILNRQLIALQRTAATMDDVQLQLATGRSVNSALDNPQNFFTSLQLENRASDLTRLLDGIRQSFRTIEVAQSGIDAGLQLIEQAEAYAADIKDRFAAGDLPSFDEDAFITARIQEILAINPNAIDLGNGAVAEIYTAVGTVTFTPPSDVAEVEYLIVGGGGGGGSSTFFSTAGSGGGGGGGVLTGSITVQNQAYDVTVGAGGAAGPNGNNSGSNGQDSSFGLNVGTGLTALGGGGGVGGNGNGLDGGSGGGGRGGVAGVGLQPTTPQGGDGNDGGSGASTSGNGGGGGGGAGTGGGALSAFSGGTGGDGIESLILNTSQFYGAGGGGGGANADAIGIGGNGGGGNGGNDGIAATAGAANTGGGGGGGNNDLVGAAGGSGIVILRYNIEPNEPTEEEIQYSKILNQLDQLVLDASYRGINLLNDDNLITYFNESYTHSLETEGIDATSQGLGLEHKEFLEVEDADAALEELRLAKQTLRSYGQTIATDITIIEIRQFFTSQTINTLEAGSDDLVVADQNELGAQFLALQTRQALQFNVLSLGAQQAVLSLFS